MKERAHQPAVGRQSAYGRFRPGAVSRPDRPFAAVVELAAGPAADKITNMTRTLLTLFFAVAFLPAASAQPRYFTLEEARTATRCSVLYGVSAREAQGDKVRAANLAAKSLMLKAAGLSAGPNLMASWLDEMEPELSTSDGKVLMVLDDDCKRLMREHREFLGHVLKGNVK